MKKKKKKEKKKKNCFKILYAIQASNRLHIAGGIVNILVRADSNPGSLGCADHI